MFSEVIRVFCESEVPTQHVGLVEKHGYPTEEHNVPTEDGYKHGILGSSDFWVLVGPDRDLAFLLADAGYDVWIGNCYGRSHTNLSSRDRDFCNFRPECNDRVRLVVSLAPIAIWKRLQNPLLRLAVLKSDLIKTTLDDNGIYEIGTETDNDVRLGRTFCSDDSITQSACVATYFLIAGHDPEQLNSSFLPHLTSYVSAGTSTLTLYHYWQNIMSGNFQKFDHGYKENFRDIRRIRKEEATDLRRKENIGTHRRDLRKEQIPSTESNMVELIKRLRNVVTLKAVPYDSFNHLDFLWATNAKQLLFDRIMKLVSNNSDRSRIDVPYSSKAKT